MGPQACRCSAPGRSESLRTLQAGRQGTESRRGKRERGGCKACRLRQASINRLDQLPFTRPKLTPAAHPRPAWCSTTSPNALSRLAHQVSVCMRDDPANGCANGLNFLVAHRSDARKAPYLTCLEGSHQARLHPEERRSTGDKVVHESDPLADDGGALGSKTVVQKCSSGSGRAPRSA